MTPSVCLTMLVRNESAVITRALDSALAAVPGFDSFCIVDTGSTDDTREKIAAWMSERGKFGVIHDRPWVNFGHNRTEALELAAKRGETFALLLDADQTFVGRLEIDDSQGIARYDAVNVRGTTEYVMPVALRCGLPWRYEGMTHEALTCAEKHVGAVLRRLRVVEHADSVRRSSGRKNAEDIALLEAETRANPGNARAWFYLGRALAEEKRWRAAWSAFMRCVEVTTWPEEKWHAHMGVCECKGHDGVSGYGVREELLRAYSSRPSRAEPLLHLARISNERGEYAAARMFAAEAACMPVPEGERLWVDRSAYGWAAWQELAMAEAQMGNRNAAAESLRRLLDGDAPDDVREAARENLERMVESRPQAARLGEGDS